MQFIRVSKQIEKSNYKKMEIIADCNVLTGQSNKSILQSHEYLNRFKTKKSRKIYIKNAVSNNINSFFCTYDIGLLKALNKNIEIYPSIPNVSQYVRDLNNYGLISMGFRKLVQLGFGLFSLIPTVVKNGFGALNKDFRALIVLLSDIEMVKFKKFKPKIVFLHYQMADLFLANNSYESIKSFSILIRKKYNSEPALFTNNISQTLKRLNEWNSDIKYICTPVNSKGYRMKPNQKEAENSIKKTNRTIIGYDITCGGTLKLKDSIKYAKKLNVNKVIVEASSFPIK